MDFWSRLVGGSGKSTVPLQAPTGPQLRLNRFTRVCEQLQHLYLKNKKLSIDSITIETPRKYLETLKCILQDEVQAPVPHPCIAHVVEARVYNVVAKVAIQSHSEHVVNEALDIFNVLIEGEEGGFLDDEGFANTLIGFVNNISPPRSFASIQTEGNVAEILFGLATKLRLRPETLPAWFRPRAQRAITSPMKPNSVVVTTNLDRLEFPLFYFLLDYVHHDGRAGDFARTGLLYIIESAVYTEELERWIVESDLAALMASGLGALYSQLSRKLVMMFTTGSVPAVVAISNIAQPRPPYDATETGSAEFQAHLGTFLSYLMFWQDVLEHCTSNDIKQTLLDHFRFLFLHQLLYPSLVESSDVDGGSSVAVLTYLRCILESINQIDLIQLILQYLLALPDPPPEKLPTLRPTTIARRRKSETLITNLAKGEAKPSPNLFTLVDLLLSSLQSHNQQTVTASLRLYSVILHSQHRYAISTLIKVQPLDVMNSPRTLDAHNLGVDIILSMAEDLAIEEDLEASYETHMLDVHHLLEAHSCSAQILALPDFSQISDQMKSETHNSLRSKQVGPHRIAIDDPLLNGLVLLLNQFLYNDIETNLSLTQTFTILASCGYTRLEGWLLGVSADDGSGSDHDMSSEDGFDEASMATNGNQTAESRSLKIAQPPSARHSPSTSPVFAAIYSLIGQIDNFRQKIPNFDTYLVERKHIFRISDEIDSALADPSLSRQKSEDPKSHSSIVPSPQTQAHLLGSMSQRLLFDGSPSSNVSRSSSPRGRQQDESAVSKLAPRFNQLRISPSRSPSKLGVRAYSSSPLRNRTPPISTPSTPMGPPDVLLQKVRMPITRHATLPGTFETPWTPLRNGSSETTSLRSVDSTDVRGNEAEVREVTLGHLLTNVVILQEFVLELAAVVEVRAGLFVDEIKFV